MGVEQAEMMGIFPVAPEDEQIYVATVPDKVHGAGVLAYQDFMDQAAERAGGEALGILWSDIDFEKRILTISRAMNDRPDGNGKCRKRIQSTKTTARNRDIPLVSEVVDAFLT